MMRCRGTLGGRAEVFRGFGRPNRSRRPNTMKMQLYYFQQVKTFGRGFGRLANTDGGTKKHPCFQPAAQARARDHAVADGLRRRGIDCTTTADAGLLGADDPDHLGFAKSQGRVLYSNDSDLLRGHNQGVEHCGIAYCHQHGHSSNGVTTFPAPWLAAECTPSRCPPSPPGGGCRARMRHGG